MKLTFCIIATLLLISFSSSLASDNAVAYDLVSIQDVKKDSLIIELLNYGINIVFKKSAQKYNVSDEDIEVTEIHSVLKQELKTKTYYQFNVEAENEDGDVLAANYTVKYELKIKKKSLVEWSSDLDINHGSDDEDHCEYEDTDEEEEEEEDNGDDGDNGDESDDDYQEIDPSDYDTKIFKQLVAQGLDYVVKNEPKRIPQDTYYLDEIVEASKKHTTNLDYYQFEIQAQNKKGNRNLRIKFTSQVQNGSSKVLYYSFSTK